VRTAVKPSRLVIAVCLFVLPACTRPGTRDGAAVEVPFAPYVDVTYPHPELVTAAEHSPARRFVLSFALANQGRCEPAWGGFLPVDHPTLLEEIRALRNAGGSVTVATGGALGSYLENVCATADELAGAYRKALTVTGADELDVDVETRIPVDRVADALSALRSDPGIDIRITVAVQSAERGLAPATVTLLSALAERGTEVTVNAMIMNFAVGGSWRESMIDAAETVTDQISDIWPEGGRPGAYRRLGLTLMAGRNDTGVITTLDDARAVTAYARAHRIGFLGFWSLARDNGGCPSSPTARNDCSGIGQDAYAFTRSLAGETTPR